MFVVFQALSVIQSLPNPRNKDLNDLAAALHALQQSTEKTSHPMNTCNIPGNEEADRLAEEGRKLPQEKQPKRKTTSSSSSSFAQTGSMSYEEAKTMVKEKQRRR